MNHHSMATSSPSKSKPSKGENLASCPSSSAPKPFFIMDWLEELIVDQDVEKIAEMLQTPNKQPLKYEYSRQYAQQYSKQNPLTPSCSASTATTQASETSTSIDNAPGTPKSSNRNTDKSPASPNPDISPSQRRRLPAMEPQMLFMSKSKAPSPSSTSNTTSVYKRSIALGNGWNAKGLKKAKQGLWQDALACWENALEIRRQLLGDNHLEVANTYNNQGIALGKLGHTNHAIEALARALKIRQQILGIHHGQVISTWHNLANVHQQIGNLQTSLECFGEAKSLSSVLGKTSTQTARICTAMGHVYYQAKQWLDARDAYQDAMDIYLSKPDHASHKHEVLDLQRDIEELDQRLARQPPPR